MKLGVFSHCFRIFRASLAISIDEIDLFLSLCDLQVLRLQLPSVELLVYDSDGRRVPS